MILSDNWCVFPISGPMTRPTADRYEAEAVMLRRVGADMERRKQRGWQRFYAVAHGFARVARKLRWSEQTARSHRQEERAA